MQRNVFSFKSLSKFGFAGYYSKFIRNFAHIAAPLTDLTKDGVKFTWSQKCEAAFQELKLCLTKAPVLAYPSERGQFILDTDSSGFGIGGVLSQVQSDGTERVIAYGSKTLDKSQRNYCTTMRELLAVVVFVRKFHHYLWGNKFVVRTDHASLQWLLNFKEPENMLARWLAILSTYDMEIQHRKGVNHRNADELSRQKPRRCKRDDCEDCALTRSACICAVTTRRQSEVNRDRRQGRDNTSQDSTSGYAQDQIDDQRAQMVADQGASTPSNDKGQIADQH